ncbi:hypothetical protein [Aeromicrobium sp. JJY06]|uniref:hypothetical protein n=1 Tax=Aeromicrobium sp. JJY06 TaxID=3373478 RepID=UPI00376EBDE6
MQSWWHTANPDILVAPDGELGPRSVRASRFVDRERVQPGPSGRTLWPRLADVLATVADVTPLSLYETSAEDITLMHGRTMHWYATAGSETLVETVDECGWRRFAFVPPARAAAALIGSIATGSPDADGRWLACALADPRGSVVLSDGDSLLLGDLPPAAGPILAPMHLASEDVSMLLLARLRVPALT